MKVTEDFLKALRRPPKTLFDDEPDAPIRGPLFPKLVLYALLAVFCTTTMLSADWFGLLLLNSRGVTLQMGILNVLRVTAALMMGVTIPSALLMAHYRRVYSYTSWENVFFATTFFISFVLGAPCLLAGVFG